jgi:DNA-binding GntR family transcriptional regulator
MPGEAKFVDSAFRGLKSLPERRSLGQHVYLRLRQAILRGELAPGSRLVESRLADALGISRTPVREGIHKLERENLVCQGPSGGFFVAGVTREDIRETFGIRAVLESYAACLAALQHREEELAPLDRKIQEYQASMDRGDLGSLLRINTEFHDLLYGLSRSPRLIKMINDLRDQIFRFRQVLLKEEAWARVSNEDHRLMLVFIRKRDAEGVERLVRDHILRGQAVVLQHFDLPGPAGPEIAV